MSALTLFIIRHAEKPDGAWPGPGLSEAGEANDKSLVIRGWQRAGAWAALFGSGLDPDYPQPAAIFAAKPDEEGAGPTPSKRPYETIIPLAARLRIVPVTDFAKSQGDGLAARLVELTGVVLVSWDRESIAKVLLPRLLGGQRIDSVPTTWSPDRFDVVLRLDRAHPNAPWSFRQLFPRLLSGDSDVPLDRSDA